MFSEQIFSTPHALKEWFGKGVVTLRPSCFSQCVLKQIFTLLEPQPYQQSWSLAIGSAIHSWMQSKPCFDLALKEHPLLYYLRHPDQSPKIVIAGLVDLILLDQPQPILLEIKTTKKTKLSKDPSWDSTLKNYKEQLLIYMWMYKKSHYYSPTPKGFILLCHLNSYASNESMHTSVEEIPVVYTEVDETRISNKVSAMEDIIVRLSNRTLQRKFQDIFYAMQKLGYGPQTCKGDQCQYCPWVEKCKAFIPD